MILSTQSLTALALLASVVRADEGCIGIGGDQRGYYVSPSGECCSTDYAVVEDDGSIRCGDTACASQLLDGVGSCFSISKVECSNGVKVTLEAFSQPGRCGNETATPASGARPDDKVGCYSGRIYVNSGECCSTDYAVAERDDQGQVLRARCGDKPAVLAPDNRDPENLKGVPKCKGAIAEDWCPDGVHTTETAFTRKEVCSGTECCPRARQTRDENGICQHNTLNFGDERESKEFWAARERDGCDRRGQLGSCCPDPKLFRSEKGECTENDAFGEKAGAYKVAQQRRADGCDA